MKPAAFSMPTPWNISENFEIAPLYLLSNSLELVSRTIIAAHPILLNDELPYWLSLSADELAAKRVLANLERLSKSILRYRKIISSAPSPPQGHPCEVSEKPSRQDFAPACLPLEEPLPPF